MANPKIELLAKVTSKVETEKLDGDTMTLAHLGLVLAIDDEVGQGDAMAFALHLPAAVWNTLRPGSTLVFRLSETRPPVTPAEAAPTK